MNPRNQQDSSRGGFTIIEVVLVLAIAGLIFLMVFIALPALQRSQRDTQRRNDYSELSTAVTNYITNNNGKLSKIAGSSGEATLDASKYINDTGEDPNGLAYTLKAITVSKLGTTRPGEGQVFVVIGADCNGTDSANGDSRPKSNSSHRAFAIYGYLEGGNQTYCSASQ